eukprot:s760_g8.t2
MLSLYFSDSSGVFQGIDGLGFLPGLCCPHHDRVQSNGILRADDFEELLRRHPTERGICIDDWTALEIYPDGSYRASEYRGAAFPLPRNMPSVWEAWPVSGVALRFGNRARESVAPLGCRVTDLSRIECGKVSARVDHTGATRVPQFPKDCWFTLAEDDFLRYHDLDIALFFGNLRANCEERYRAFLPRGRL